MRTAPPSARRATSSLSSRTDEARRTWLITFTDLISLLLAFFVMLFAMSGVKVELWEATVSALSGTLRAAPADPPSPSADANVTLRKDVPSADLDYLAAVLKHARGDAPPLAGSHLERISDGLILTTNVAHLFGPGSAQLAPAARATLSVVAGLLRNIDNDIGVRIGFGELRSSTAGYRPAFSLALARSAAVVDALHTAGYDRPVAAYAVGGTVGRTASIGNGLAPATDRLEIVILPEGDSV